MNSLQILLDSLKAAAIQAKTLEDYDIYMNLHHQLEVQIKAAESREPKPPEDDFAS